MNGALVSTALLLFGVAASQHAYAVVLISDSFNRTTGVVGDDTVIPPIDGVSDWGSFDNAEGGTVAPIPYKLTVNNNPGNEEITDGANGIINHDPLFIDYNLAADPNVQAADGVRIRVDVNPNDIGGAGDFGRDWLAIGFADTNNNVDSIQNDTFVTGTNVDARIGIGVRNSGSAITRRAIATGTGGPTLERFRTGIPHEINEPIFDQPTYDAYVAHWDAENTPPVTPEVTTEFTSDVWYTVEFNIFKDGSSQHLFEDDAQMRFQVYIGRRGETLNRLDFNVSTPAVEDTFFWGDNQKTTPTSNQEDPTPGQSDAYIVLSANGSGGTGHRFDNLVVETITAPAFNPSDFNDSGSVDLADLEIWRGAYGSTAAGDANADNVSDGADFLIWQRNLGATWAAAVASAVPEPASLLLTGATVAFASLLRTRTYAARA